MLFRAYAMWNNGYDDLVVIIKASNQKKAEEAFDKVLDEEFSDVRIQKRVVEPLRPDITVD